MKQPRGDGERYVTPARAAAKETTGASDFKISDRLSHAKYRFGPLIIQLVWFILKQLFTSVSVKVEDLYFVAR